MKRHLVAALIGFLIGVAGFFVLFMIGSITGRGEVGFIAGCILFLFLCIMLVRKQVSSWWYIGTMINIPAWGFFVFLAEKGQFELYTWYLVALFISSYTGVFIGLRLFKHNKIE